MMQQRKRLRTFGRKHDRGCAGSILLFRVYNISNEEDELMKREKAYDSLQRIIKPIQTLDYDKELVKSCLNARIISQRVPKRC